MIGVINYGLGNIKAFLNVYERLNVAAKIIKNEIDFEGISKLILPGVGAFDQAMIKLNSSGLRDKLEILVCNDKIPILGVCVGMQMLSNSSDEGDLAGLGWIDGEVKKFNYLDIPYKTKLPHMGWNNVSIKNDNPLMKGLSENSKFYFLHSYFFSCSDKSNVLTSTNYGKEFTSAVNHENVYGVQFHPEKSHNNGVTILNNFSSL
tara:strand:+ start:15256 stop:15870 length:615 start_codon:yes stop_codon:yes gene_type:complete